MKPLSCARLIAALLRSAASFQKLAALQSLAAAAGFLLAASLGSGWACALFGASLALAPTQAWFALRCEFDAAAFEFLAEDETALAEFDAHMAQLGLKPGPDARDLPARALAAKGLISRLGALCVVQLALILIAGGLMYAHV